MTLSRFDASPRSSLIKLLIVLFVLAIALTSAIPGYFHFHWSWQQPSPISNVKQLKAIQQNGLSLPGWQTLEQKTVEIGGHKWSAQAIVPEAEAKTATSQTVIWLLLRPQTWERDLPQIDWTDINGMRRWTTDSHRQLKFIVQSPQEKTVQMNTRFFRGWAQNRTDAVLQWYAWSDGGSSAPSDWFWADQLKQIRTHQSLAWVAVSLQLPIEPFGEINQTEAKAEALGQLVQSTLMKTALQ